MATTSPGLKERMKERTDIRIGKELLTGLTKFNNGNRYDECTEVLKTNFPHPWYPT